MSVHSKQKDPCERILVPVKHHTKESKAQPKAQSEAHGWKEVTQQTTTSTVFFRDEGAQRTYTQTENLCM